MRFRQIRLQLQSTLGQRTRFFTTLRRGVERVNDPAFQLRVAGESKREVWIQVQSALEKLLPLFEFFVILHSAGKIVRLYEGKVGLAVFSGLVCHLRLFARRQLGLERFGEKSQM